MARVGAPNDERGIHVHVVAGKIQGNEALEEDGPAREGGGEKDEETGGGATVGDHVEHGTEAGRLLEDAGSPAIEGVEQAGDAVEDGARAWVQGHVIEGGDGEDDARIA